MSRAYLRLDPMSYERKVIKQGYPLDLFAAFQGTICQAEHQPERGRFRDAALLRVLLGRGGRLVPELLRRGDLVSLDDGRLYVDGWDEWQEGDWKVNERVSRIRNRHRAAAAAGSTVSTVTPVTVESVTPVTVESVTPVTNATVYTPSDVSVIDAVGGKRSGAVGASGASGARADVLPHVTPPVAEAWESATGRTLLASGDFACRTIDDLCDRQGPDAVIAAIPVSRSRFARTPSPQQLAADLRNHLEPLPKGTPEEVVRSLPRAPRREPVRIDEADRQRVLRELTGRVAEGGAS